MAGTGDNIWSVLAESAGAAVSGEAAAMPGRKQQAQENKLALTMTMMKAQEADRAAALHQKDMLLTRLKIQKANEELTGISRLSAMTPEQRAKEEALSELAKLQEYTKQLPALQGLVGQYPGTEIKLGPLSLGAPKQFTGRAPTSDEFKYNVLGKDKYEALLFKDGSKKSSGPSEKDQRKAAMNAEKQQLLDETNSLISQFPQDLIDKLGIVRIRPGSADTDFNKILTAGNAVRGDNTKFFNLFGGDEAQTARFQQLLDLFNRYQYAGTEDWWAKKKGSVRAPSQDRSAEDIQAELEAVQKALDSLGAGE